MVLGTCKINLISQHISVH